MGILPTPGPPSVPPTNFSVPTTQYAFTHKIVISKLNACRVIFLRHVLFVAAPNCHSLSTSGPALFPVLPCSALPASLLCTYTSLCSACPEMPLATRSCPVFRPAFYPTRCPSFCCALPCHTLPSALSFTTRCSPLCLVLSFALPYSLAPFYPYGHIKRCFLPCPVGCFT